VAGFPARSRPGQIFPFAAAAAFTTIALAAIRRPNPATSHQAGSRELSERLKIYHPGAAMESDMAGDTVVDAELWLILAAMLGWIVLGCFLTAHHRHHGPRPSPLH